MMKRKSVIALLLAAVMILALAACGNSGASGGSTSGGNASGGGAAAPAGQASGDNNTAAPADEAPYEVVIEIMGSGLPQEDQALVEEELSKLTLPAINCTVKFRDIAIADHATQMGLLGASGDQLDIIFVGYTTNVANLKANGLLLPLGDLLNQYGQDILKQAGVLMDACYVTDDYYCVPGNYYPGVRNCLSLDTQVLEENNIQIPENPEASYEYLEKLYKAVKDSGFTGYGFSAGDGAGGITPIGHFFEKFGSSMGADNVYGVLMNAAEDTQVVNLFDTDEYMEAAKWQRHCYEEGYMDPDSLTSGRTQVDAARAGMVLGGVSASNATFALSSYQITGRMTTSIPFGDMTITGPSIPEYGLGVTINSKRPDKAVQMLNLIFTNTDVANMINYGIEGKHYVKLSEHIIGYPEGVDRMSVGWGNQINSFGDSSKIFHREPYTEEWYEEVKEYGVDNAKISKAFGYVYDPTAVKTQVAACSAVIGEYAPSLACGLVEDVESRVEEFRAALKTAGIEDIIADNQKQFDAWLAANGK